MLSPAQYGQTHPVRDPMTIRIPSLCVAALLASTLSFAQSVPASRPLATSLNRSAIVGHYDAVPLAFEANHGQTNPSVRFLSRGSGYTVFLEPDTATLFLHRTPLSSKQTPADRLAGKTAAMDIDTVKMHLLGANGRATMSAEKALPGYVSYMSGADRSNWKLGLPTYAATRVSNAYPGIDLVYYGNGHQLEYDFVLAPGADALQVKLSLDGAKPVLENTGELRLQAGPAKSQTDMVFRKPVLYQKTGGKRQPVDGSYTVAANGEVSFRVGAYDHARELIIDPVISYASYFGGSSEDEINASALNANNELYAVGQTFSTTLPATSGEFQTGSYPGDNGHDAFVTKFSADGSSVLWTTYLSGIADDFATGVAVNTADQAYITGYTNSCGSNGTGVNTPGEFPFTADAVQKLCNPQVIGFNNDETNGGNYDAFLVKLSSDGKTELYGTPLGGSSNDIAQGVALDAAGQIYIVGETISTGYHYAVEFKNDGDTPAYPINNHGTPSIGTANYPTTANAFYTNTTESIQYATTNPDGSKNGPTDEQAFLTVLSADGHSIVYSSLIGGGIIGGCGNGACNTDGLALAVSTSGIAYIGGNTSSAHWPTTAGVFAPACSNAGAANSQCAMTGWIAAFDPTKSGAASLVFSTYVTGKTGGTNADGTNIFPGSDVYGLATDSTGNVVLTGDTGSHDFPTTAGTFQTTCAAGTSGSAQVNQCAAAYIMKLSPSGSIVWSTYYGSIAPTGAGASLIGSGVALDAKDNVYVVGNGNETSPVKNPIVATPQGGPDVFLVELTPDASTLLFGTWLGATGGLSLNNGSLHLDSNLNAYFSGYQCPNPYGGTGFPITANAFDKAIAGCDGFVVAMSTQQQVSSTALQITPNAGAPGASISFTATVAGVSGLAVPTGTVSLISGQTALGSITLANGTGNFTTTALAAGTYSVIGTYSGDSLYAGSASTAQAVAIQNTPSVALTATPSSAPLGTAIALAAAVTSSVGTPTGTVYFMDGSTNLGSAVISNGTASYSATALGAGAHSIVATYGGDTNFATVTSAAQTVTITGAPASITAAFSPSSLTITAGATGTSTLTVTPANGFAGTLTLSCGPLPSSASCGFSSPTLTFAAASSAAQTSTLTISTSAAVVGTLRPAVFRRGLGGALNGIALGTVLLLPLGITRRGRRSLGSRSISSRMLALVTLLAVGSLNGCSGGSSPKPTSTPAITPAGTYTVAVTIAGAPAATTLNLQVIVQ